MVGYIFPRDVGETFYYLSTAGNTKEEWNTSIFHSFSCDAKDLLIHLILIMTVVMVDGF